MEFLADIFGGLGVAAAGVASGGILSVLGVAIKGLGAWAKRRQEAKAKQAEWDNEYKLEELRQKGRNQDTENEVKIAQSKGSWRGLEVSHQSVIAPQHVSKWVNNLRSMFRPFLTVFLLVMTWAMFRDLMAILKGGDAALAAAFTPEQAGETVRYIVYSTVFSASTAVTWWYGDRALTPSALKNR